MSVIFIDSACDLSPVQAKKLGLEIVQLPVKLNGKAVGKSDDAYNLACTKHDELKLNVDKQDFIKAFQQYLDNEENILYLSTNQIVFNITKPFSDAVKELNIKYPDREIKIYNLELTSVVAGVLLYEVGLLYKRGDTDLEIINFIDEFKTCARGYIVTNQKKFISICKNSESVNVKSKLGVNAIVEYKMNNISVLDYVNGRKKALNQIVEMIESNSINMADYTIQVGYAMQEQTAQIFKAALEKKFNGDCTVLLQKLSLDNVMLYNGDTIIVGYHGKKHQA